MKRKHLHRAVFYPDRHGIADANPADGRGRGYTEAWHRREWEYSPFCRVNEFVAAEIGRALRLPIPAYAMSRADTGREYFSSLDFNFDRDQLPPVEPDCCWKHLPFLSTGVVMFDVLIANCDRHDENLVVDHVIRPTAMQVFDHDQALLGGGDPSLRGTERLEKLVNSLGISGGTITGGNRHCLLDHIDSNEHFEAWIRRITSLQDWFIDDVCREVQQYGATKAEALAIAGFLKGRRNDFEGLIKRNRDDFRGMTEWTRPNELPGIRPGS